MSADKVVPSVELEIGGKKRLLAFDMWAYYLLEKQTGKNLLKGDLFNDPGLGDILTLTWAGLQTDAKNTKSPISLEQVCDALNFEDIPRVSEAIKLAFEKASPQVKKNLEEAPVIAVKPLELEKNLPG